MQYTIQDLKNLITDRIHENHERAIDGVDLQEFLHDILDSLSGYTDEQLVSPAINYYANQVLFNIATGALTLVRAGGIIPINISVNLDGRYQLIGSFEEEDPIVAAIVGIVKSDGSTISAATPVTDYLPGYSLLYHDFWATDADYLRGDIVMVPGEGSETGDLFWFMANQDHTSIGAYLPENITDLAKWNLIHWQKNAGGAQVNSDWEATTGAEEILNKPTIPDPQIQSDYTQADTEALDFIKNKLLPVTDFMPGYTLLDKSEWTTATVYSKGDIVRVIGEATLLDDVFWFMANQDHTSIGGYLPENITDLAKWNLIHWQKNAGSAQVNSDWDAVSGVEEILNKPTISAEQIQSDWNQSNNTLKDFIKNKPAVSQKVLMIKVLSDTTVLTTGNGKMKFPIPFELNGMVLVKAHAAVTTVSSSGDVTVAIYNYTDSVDMLSTSITIDDTEYTSYSAFVPPVINTAHNEAVTGDILGIDIDVAGTGAKGLTMILTFDYPAIVEEPMG